MPRADVLDLCALPVWERAATVLSAGDRLRPGETLALMTEIDPRALIGHLEALRPRTFAFDPRRIGEGSWSIHVSRLQPDIAAATLQAAFVRSTVLAALGDSAQARFAAAAVEGWARRGQTLCEENVPREELGVLLEGSLGVFAGAGSRERLLFHVFAYDLFGEIEFLDGGLSVGRTVVLSKTARYALVPHAVVRETAERDSRFLQRLAARSAQQSRELAQTLASQLAQPILARVAAALLPYAAPERGLHPALAPLSTMTQAQLAASAGTVKEVAARAIAELERQDALRRERGHIALLDRSMLLAIVDRG